MATRVTSFVGSFVRGFVGTFVPLTLSSMRLPGILTVNLHSDLHSDLHSGSHAENPTRSPIDNRLKTHSGIHISRRDSVHDRGSRTHQLDEFGACFSECVCQGRRFMGTCSDIGYSRIPSTAFAGSR